jgi:hypothetical protein
MLPFLSNHMKRYNPLYSIIFTQLINDYWFIKKKFMYLYYEMPNAHILCRYCLINIKLRVWNSTYILFINIIFLITYYYYNTIIFRLLVCHYLIVFDSKCQQKIWHLNALITKSKFDYLYHIKIVYDNNRSFFVRNST